MNRFEIIKQLSFQKKDVYHVDLIDTDINGVELYIDLQASPMDYGHLLDQSSHGKAEIDMSDFNEVLSITQKFFGAYVEINSDASVFSSDDGSLKARLYTRTPDPNSSNRKIASKAGTLEKWDEMNRIYNPAHKNLDVLVGALVDESFDTKIQRYVPKLENSGYHCVYNK